MIAAHIGEGRGRFETKTHREEDHMKILVQMETQIGIMEPQAKGKKKKKECIQWPDTGRGKEGTSP